MKKIITTTMILLLLATVIIAGCQKSSTTQSPTTTTSTQANSLDGNVSQGINDVEQTQNITDPSLDANMANVQDSLNKW